MSAPATYDVAVVGAGPAGATAARELARAGARVVLLEKEAPPRYKTCGGGLVGRALRLLPADLDWRPEHVCRRAEMHLGQLTYAVERAEPLVTMCMRAELDAALVREAERAGAELRASEELVGISAAGGALELETSRGRLRARLLAGADGALSAVARAAGFPAHATAIPALEAELPVGADDLRRFAGAARFDFGIPADGYAWVFPKRAHLSVGVLSTRRGSSHLRRVLEDYLAGLGLPALGASDVHGFVIPFAPRPGGAVRGAVCLLGDAAGLADPVTGEGISNGLASGALLARAFAEAGGDPLRAARGYGQKLEREVLSELRIARAAAWTVYRAPRLRRALFGLRGQHLCETMASLMAGERGYTELVGSPAAWWRLATRRGSPSVTSAGRRDAPAARGE